MRCMLLAVLSISLSAWAGQPPLTIEARGLSVAGDGYGEFMDGVQPFNNNLGTRVALFVMAPSGGLLKFNADKSKLTAFTDDKGKDLSKTTKKGGFHNTGFSSFAHISKDTKACIVDVETPELPTKGAGTVTVSGEAVFTFATQKKDFEVPTVALKAGTTFKAGDLNFEIKKTGKADFDAENWPVEIEFGFKQSTGNLADVKFIDVAGKVIETSRSGGSSMSFGNTVSESITYKMKKPAETVKVVVTLWMDMKDVAVPFNLKVGPGL